MSDTGQKLNDGFMAEYASTLLYVQQRPDHVEFAVYDRSKKQLVWGPFAATDIESAKSEALIAARQYLARSDDLPITWKPYHDNIADL